MCQPGLYRRRGSLCAESVSQGKYVGVELVLPAKGKSVLDIKISHRLQCKKSCHSISSMK
ncbi:hypothetical protein IF2G_00921 [Cordyceps javanica]|nr:hypothetical protein IF2G_00921 [Cordyceps javanica]